MQCYKFLKKFNLILSEEVDVIKYTSIGAESELL